MRFYPHRCCASAEPSSLWVRDFFATQALGTGGSCDRDSDGQYRDEEGAWQIASADVARFDHDGSAYALLNEPAGATNLYWPSAAATTKGITVDGGVLATDVGGTTSLTSFRSNSDWQKYANKWTPAADKSVTAISADLLRNGSPSGNVWLEIIRASDAALIATSEVLVASAVSASPTWTTYAFAFTDAAVSAGVAYYIAVCADYAYSTTNRLQIRTRSNDSTVWYKDGYRLGASTWETADSYHTANMSVEGIGSEYIVWLDGSGSVALSGALSGTVTDGSPVTGVASGSNTLTLTVTGSPDHLQVEAGDTPTSRIATVSAAASRANEAITWTGVDADNETRMVIDGADVDVDDWDGSLADAAYAGRISSITVYAPGERPE